MFRNGDTKLVTFCNRSMENYFSLYVIIRNNVYQEIFLFYFIFETGSPYVTLAGLKLRDFLACLCLQSVGTKDVYHLASVWGVFSFVFANHLRDTEEERRDRFSKPCVDLINVSRFFLLKQPRHTFSMV